MSLFQNKNKTKARLILTASLLFFILGSSKIHAEESNPDALDWEWKKSEVLENLLNQKLDNIITGSGIAHSHFRSSVVVLFHEAPPPPKVEKKPPPPVKATDLKKETLDFPELLANPADIDALVAKYKNDSTEDKAPFFGFQPEATASELKREGLKKYQVSFVNMAVTVDPMVSADRVKELETQIKNSFSPAFGSQLVVQVKPSPIIDALEPTFWDRLEKFQKLALGLLLLLAAFVLTLLWKLIPARRSPHQFDFNHKKLEESAKNSTNSEKPNPETPKPLEEELPSRTRIPAAELDPAQKPKDEVTLDFFKEAERLEAEIVEMVRENPALSRMMLEDFLRFDFVVQNGIASQSTKDAMLRVALFLETLARSKIPCEKLKVKDDIFREFQKIRSQVSELSIQTKVQCLGETYWALVSYSFLSNGEQSFPPFYFLEGLEDIKVAKLLSTEPPAMQAIIFLGMSEKKSARVLQAVQPSIRQTVFEQMCSGNNPDSAEIQTLVERVREKSIPFFEENLIPTSPEEGISAIATILQQLDFRAQFDSVKNLFLSAPELRRQLKGQIFFVALLPEARADYLAEFFKDRSIDWIKTVFAGFNEQFRAQVLEFLPSMQRQILDGADLSRIPVAAKLKLLQEIQSEIRLLIEKNEITLGEIFELADKENVNANHDTQTFPRAA